LIGGVIEPAVKIIFVAAEVTRLILFLPLCNVIGSEPPDQTV
jgi:hypothetical protein